MSLRDRILAASDIESEVVHVPVWNLDIEVRGMNGRARARFLSDFTGDDGQINFEKLYPEVVIGCCFDPDSGERIFNEDDRDAILEKAGSALELLASTAIRISGLNEKAVDEAGKSSSSTTPPDASTSS